MAHQVQPLIELPQPQAMASIQSNVHGHISIVSRMEYMAIPKLYKTTPKGGALDIASLLTGYEGSIPDPRKLYRTLTTPSSLCVLAIHLET
jgi:hypothetical protein